MLELRNVSSGYGAIEALKSINLRIDQGEIVTLIGANGAGKSTTLRNITGLVPATAGDVLFEGRTLNGVPTHQDHGDGHFDGAGRPSDLRQSYGVRKISRWARTFRRTRRRTRRNWNASYALFPAFEGAAQAAGRNAQRRRAADAGHRPRADGAAATAVAR